MSALGRSRAAIRARQVADVEDIVGIDSPRNIVIVGDSISKNNPYSMTGHRCWADQFKGMLPPGWSCSIVGVGSRPFAGWTDAELTAKIAPLKPTDVILPLGTNDVANASPLATMKVDAAALWTRCHNRGWRVWPTTIPAGNFSGTPETNRIGFDYGWLLATSGGNAFAGGLVGTIVYRVIDWASIVSPSLAAIWDGAGVFTVDQIHPTTEGGLKLARWTADYMLAYSKGG